MRYKKQTIEVFFSLLRAGLWEQKVRLAPFGSFDFGEIYDIADNQSVVGLVAAGLEHIEDVRIAKQQALPFMKKVFSLENKNASMNRFIADLLLKFRDVNIYAVLVKGQGIAQCYERPQWRAPGDVDLLLEENHYQKAKTFLIPLASFIDREYKERRHLCLTVDSWSVELHGTLRSDRLGRVNHCIDSVQEDTFKNGRVRVWRNGNSDVFIPAADNDLIFVFTHILQHFFAGGIGLRQVCDWCRLLWTFRNDINKDLLGYRLKETRLKSEWCVFASLAVNYLGMPFEAIPFYQKSASLDRKAHRLVKHILRTGNFGHNRDMSYLQKNPYLIRKFISFWRVTQDIVYRLLIFPVDSIEFYFRYILSGSKSVLTGA